MELKDFVAATLTNIVEGVELAQERFKGTPADVNPELDSSVGRDGSFHRGPGTFVRGVRSLYG